MLTSETLSHGFYNLLCTLVPQWFKTIASNHEVFSFPSRFFNLVENSAQPCLCENTAAYLDSSRNT